MDNYIHDFSGFGNLWGYTDILENDLEQQEFNKNFDSHEESYESILDNQPVYHSFLNFFEEEQDELYADDYTESEDDEDTPEDRTTYMDMNLDDVFYLI